MNPAYTDRPLIWSPAILTASFALTHDAALSGHLAVTSREGKRRLLDRRLWHPPLEPRPVVGWIEDMLACYLAYETEELREWQESVS